jgi:YVTN family beta-propeller protein
MFTNVNNAVSVVSTATNTVVATVPLVDQPSLIAVANLNAPMATLKR